MKAQMVIQIVVCILVVAGFFGITATYVFNPYVFDSSAKEQLYLITGSMMAAFGQVVNWAFNSSIGSARKTELLAKADPINETQDTELSILKRPN